MARLGSRLLTITIDGTDFTFEVLSAKITATDPPTGDVSFGEAAQGGTKIYNLVIKYFQDPSANSLWDKFWSSAGTTVPAVLHPAGGVTVDATHPALTGNVIIPAPDGDIIGGDASSDPNVRWTSESTLQYTAKPTRSFS